MTGLQWAVLTAYAKSLPPGSEDRVLLEDLTAKEKPSASKQRVAWILAESAQMVQNGRITAHGKRAAVDFLSLLDVLSGKAKALTPPSLKGGAENGGQHD